MSFKESIMAVIFIGIFAFGLIAFGVQFQTENNINNSLLNNDAINRTYQSVQTNLTDVSVDAESQKTSWYSDVPLIGEISLILKSITGITRVFFSNFTNFYNLFIGLISDVIGIPSVVLNGIVAIIIMSMLMLLWRVYRAGS